MTVKISLTMVPEVAAELAAELERHQSHLDEAADVVSHDEAEKLRTRVDFLGKAIETLNAQIEGK